MAQPPAPLVPCRAIVECEAKARHPEEAAAQQPHEPSATLKTFCLPPDGPAHREAMAMLQHRRKAMLQGRGPASSGSAGSGSSATRTTNSGSAGAEAPAAVSPKASDPAALAALVRVTKVSTASMDAPASPALQDATAAAATRS